MRHWNPYLKSLKPQKSTSLCIFAVTCMLDIYAFRQHLISKFLKKWLNIFYAPVMIIFNNYYLLIRVKNPLRIAPLILHTYFLSHRKIIHFTILQKIRIIALLIHRFDFFSRVTCKIFPLSKYPTQNVTSPALIPKKKQKNVLQVFNLWGWLQ